MLMKKNHCRGQNARKRVRFERESSCIFSSSSDSSSDSESSDLIGSHDQFGDEEIRDRPIKRRVIDLLPLCSELSEQEKQERWIRPEEWQHLRRSVKDQTLGMLQDIWAVSFARHFAELYVACQAPEDPEDDATAASVSGTALVPLASTMAMSSARGLEDRMIPWLAVKRRVDRAKIIQRVVQEQKDAAIGTISRTLTTSARRMGQVLAMADATAVFLEQSNNLASSSSVSTSRGT